MTVTRFPPKSEEVKARADALRRIYDNPPAWVRDPQTDIERLAAIEWLRQLEEEIWREIGRAVLGLLWLLAPFLALLAAAWAAWRTL